MVIMITYDDLMVMRMMICDNMVVMRIMILCDNAIVMIRWRRSMIVLILRIIKMTLLVILITCKHISMYKQKGR